MANSDYNKAIKAAPDNDKAYFYRALIFRKRGRYNFAIEDLDKAIELNSDNPKYYFNRGVSKYLSGFDDEAEKDFNIAKDLAKTNEQVLSEIYDLQNDVKKYTIKLPNDQKVFFETYDIFDNNNNLKCARLSEPVYITVNNNEFLINEIELYEDGKIKALYLIEPSKLIINDIIIYTSGIIEFYPNQSILVLQLSKKQSLNNLNFKKGDIVGFSEFGDFWGKMLWDEENSEWFREGE